MHDFINWKKKTVLIVSHHSTTGPPDELRDFLIPSVARVFYLKHPFSFSLGEKRSSLDMYEHGRLKKTEYFAPVPKREVCLYVKDVIACIYLMLKTNESCDICIACDNLNTLSALILKKLGKVKKVIFYSIDYTYSRFSNPILNWIYQKLEAFCCSHADINWVGTTRTIAARSMRNIHTDVSTTIIVPDGNHSRSIKKITFRNIHRHTLVYVGHVVKQQGIALVIESLSIIKKYIPDIHLIVAGTGKQLADLKEMVRRLHLEAFVQFLGYIEDHSKIEQIVAASALGVATYVPDKKSHTNYSEAGKPKLYLGCGVPVVLTGVPSIAAEIERHNAGFVVPYKIQDFARAVVTLLRDRDNYVKYKYNATKLGLTFDWHDIFTKAMIETDKKMGI